MFDILVKRSSFLKALTYAQSIVERKSTADILTHLKLEAAGTNLTITAVDNTMSLTITLPAEIDRNGALTLPVHMLYDIVRKFSEEDIKLRIDSKQPNLLEVTSGYSVFHLPFLKAEKFPRIDFGGFDCVFNMPVSSIQRIIDNNKYTISQTDSRHNLNGIFFHPILESNELRGTATDGHRLSSTVVPLPKDAKNMKPVIIPRKSIFELAKIIADGKEDLTIETSASKIKFVLNNITLISKLVDGDFPEYLSLIPYANNLCFDVLNADLAKAVDRASIILMEKSQAIEFIINGNKLEIQAGGDNQSLANEKLEVNSNIDHLQIALNARYIMDILSTIHKDSSVVFKFSDQVSSVLVQGENDPKTDFVIMPMRG